MALDCWFRDDILRVLAALTAAGDGRHGDYHLALHHVGIAFGLVKPTNGNRAPTWQDVVNNRAETEPGGSRQTVILEHKNDWR